MTMTDMTPAPTEVLPGTPEPTPESKEETLPADTSEAKKASTSPLPVLPITGKTRKLPVRKGKSIRNALSSDDAETLSLPSTVPTKAQVLDAQAELEQQRIEGEQVLAKHFEAVERANRAEDLKREQQIQREEALARIQARRAKNEKKRERRRKFVFIGACLIVISVVLFGVTFVMGVLGG